MDTQMWMNAANIAQGIVSVIAIVISAIFFIAGKNSEKATSNTLESIKAQTEILRDITAKQMSRLIKSATDQRPIDEIVTLITTVRSIPDHNLQLKEQEVRDLTAQAVEGYIGSYYYAAVANCLSQTLLPAPDAYNPADQGHVLVKQIVDKSHRDFQNLVALFQRVDSGLVNNNSVSSYFHEAQSWASTVKSTEEYYATKAGAR